MAGMKRCLALLLLALAAAQAKRTLMQMPESIMNATATASKAVTEAAGNAGGAASQTITKATQTFAGSVQATDNAISKQIDAAREAAKAAVPKQLDVSAAMNLNAAADALVPADFRAKVQAAIKNFNSADNKGVDPEIKNYAKMLAGVLMLDTSGDSDILQTKIGDLIKQLIDFTFNLAKVYITAPAKIVTELPGDLATALGHSQPQNFLAYFTDNEQIYRDLLGVVYKEDGAQGSLTHPDSVDISGNFISYAPCIVSNTPAGFAFAASGVSIVPSVLQTAPVGANIQPQGINIQPALIYVFPAGFNVQPQGLNIAPTLIGVTPGGFAVVPAGGIIGGALLGVSVAQPPSR